VRAAAVAFLLLAGCSNPKYVPGAAGRPSENKTLETCMADFAPGPGCVSLRWVNQATTKDYGSFILKTGRPNGADGSILPETPGGEVTVLLWMPTMGHGGPAVQMKQIDTGTYAVSKVIFVMAGHWEIRVQLKVGDEVKSQAILPIDL
jgi:hypothetical protein